MALKDIRDISSKELGLMFSEATTRAAQGHLAAGLSVAGLDEKGNFAYLHPDGTVTSHTWSGGPAGRN